MKKLSITLLTGGPKTKQVLQEQLQHLLGEYIEINGFSVDEGLPPIITDHVILFSSEVIKQEALAISSITGKSFIVGKRTINHEHIDKLLQIPEGSNVLMVNDDLSETIDFIEKLYQLGINHVQFVPFRKEQLFYEKIDLAVSPGEMHLCPPSIKKIINIDVRLFDMTTILKLVDCCQMSETMSSKISERYIRSIVDLQRKLLQAEQSTTKINKHLHNVVNTIDDGIIAINHNQEISVFNHRLEALFHRSAQEVIGIPIKMFLHQEIADFIINSMEQSKFFTINGVEVVIFRFHMKEENTIVATFKSVNQAFEIEKEAQRELKGKGFYAKYDLHDIIGEHSLMKNRKDIAKKLALSDHPVLIQGETGTGKELFANAMHKNSMRKNGPFLAINCSALTETLLESELFGYDEGAFTGAQRGGKKGLFELADNGTIFLDEIGDITMSLQAHLLRVLQENEIRRIGGRKIIPINVRIIAATNKNIQEKMLEGTFRSDLFYRLNVLHFSIPALRERRSDIPLLVSHFIAKSGKWVKLDPAVLEHLLTDDWFGNVRELKSIVDYMLTVCDNNTITLQDIPNYKLPLKNTKGPETTALSKSVLEAKEYLFILETIKSCNDLGKPASREWIAKKSLESHNSLTPQQVRSRLNALESEGLITKGRGRAGTKITPRGVGYLNSQRTEANKF